MSSPTDAAPLEAPPVPRGAEPPALGVRAEAGGKGVTSGLALGGAGPLVAPVMRRRIGNAAAVNAWWPS